MARDTEDREVAAPQIDQAPIIEVTSQGKLDLKVAEARGEIDGALLAVVREMTSQRIARP